MKAPEVEGEVKVTAPEVEGEVKAEAPELNVEVLEPTITVSAHVLTDQWGNVTLGAQVNEN